MSYTPKILIVDDDPRMCESIKILLDNQGYEIHTAKGGKEALGHLTKGNFDLVLLDIVMPDMDGYGVMDYITNQRLGTFVIVITGHVTIESAVEALKRGAYDYLRKPFAHEKLLSTVENALEHRRLKIDRKQMEEALRESEEFRSTLLENSPIPILVANEDTSIRYVNPKLEELTGYTSAEIIGQKAPYPWWFENPQSGNLSDRKKSIRNRVSGLERLHRKKNGEEFWIELTVTPIIRNGEYEFTLSNWVDITERKRVEEVLQESEERMKMALEGTDEGLWDWDMIAEEITFDENWPKVLGYEPGEREFDFNWWDQSLHPDSKLVFEKALNDYLEGREKYYELEYQIKDRSGEWRWIWARGICVSYDNQGKPLRMIGTHRDITERVQAKELIKASLKEKEVLLGEVYHRVKNNMQLVASLLNLQAANIKEKHYADMFKESRDRVRSMAHIHEKLYQSEDLANVNFKGYVKNLANTLFRAYAADLNKIRLKLEVKDVSLGLKTAIPCGLLINELLTNSLKYAFPEGRKGEIRISIRPIGEDTVELIYSDNGAGIPEDLDIKKTDSFGMFLINVLAEDQLGGTIELDRTGGTKFVIQFKRQE